jgi:hypothetical protein
VAGTGGGRLTTRLKFVVCERANELQQLEPSGDELAANEAGLEQLVQLGPHRRAGDRLERRLGEAAEERGSVPKQAARIRREQVIAPADRGLEGLLAVGEITQGVLTDRKRLGELVLDLCRGQRLGARGGELDREWKPVERPTDPRNRPGRLGVELERVVRRPRALREQLYGRALSEVVLAVAGR